MNIKIAFLYLLFLGAFASDSYGQQGNFIYPNPGTPLKEVLTNALELPGGSLVFCGGQFLNRNDTGFTDAVLLKTTARGKMISKKILPKPAYTNRDFPFEILQHKGKILLLSAQDTMHSSGFIIGQNRLCWRLLDTTLNVVSEKIISLDSTDYDIISMSAQQVADTTFVACMFRTTGFSIEICALLTLDATGDVIAYKELNRDFFGYSNSASVDDVKSVEVRPATATRPSGVVVSCRGTLNRTIIVGDEKFLIEVDAHLNLIDTVDLSIPLMYPLADTVLSRKPWEAIPLANGNYIVGSQFVFEHPTGGGEKLLGLSLYNSTTRKFQTSGLVPAHTYIGSGITEVLGRSLVRAGNQYYAYGYSSVESYLTLENSWVLACYDSNAKLTRSVSFSAPGYEYKATHLEALRDGGVLMLGSRTLYGSQPDYFAIRLDAAGKVLSVPEGAAENPAVFRFQIAPNPSAGQFLLTDTKGKLQEALIYDLQGRLIRRQEAQGSSATIIIAGQPAGVYLLQIRTTDGAVEWKRLMLQ